MLKIIIIEDDPIIAFDLKSVVQASGNQVIAVYHSYSEIESVNFTDIDLALLDINLNDSKDGIDIGLILKKKFRIPCIFITSYYDQKTIERAKVVAPLAYILKPYEEQDILVNLELSKMKIQTYKTAKDSIIDTFLVKSGGSKVRVNTNDILYAQAFDMYCHLYTTERRFTVSSTLKEVTEKLAGPNFIRIHKSFLINLRAIDSVTSKKVLIKHSEIPIGRTYKKILFDTFKKF